MPLPAGQDFVTLPLRASATDAAGNAASAMVDVIVDNVVPVLTITAPAANQVFNIADFSASGNVTISWTVTDGDPQARVNTVGGVAIGAGTSAPWPTVTTDNFRTYDVPVVASDRMSNSVTRNARFIVDRVAPTVSISPANDSRNVEPRDVTFTFSEEMAMVADPQVITPATSAPAGSWQGAARTVFTRSGLEPYSVFTASTASGVTDRAGNPATAATSRFHTSARIPFNGATVARGVWTYDVASDPDGVPMVVVSTKQPGPNYTIWSTMMNGSSATFSSWAFSVSNQYALNRLQAYAWRDINADLSAAPTRGASSASDEEVCGSFCIISPRLSRAYSAPGQAFTLESNYLLVPTPPYAPGDGTARVGVIDSNTYLRQPSLSYTLSAEPTVIAASGGRWNAATSPSLIPPANTSATIHVSSYMCTYGLGRWECGERWAAVTDVAPSAWWWKRDSGTPGNLSMATPENGCTMLSFPSSSGGRFIANIEDSAQRVCPGLCNMLLTVSKSDAPTSDFVVGKGAGNTLLGVGTTVGGAQLYRTTDCNTWTPVGSPLPGAVEFKPVLLGTQPGFFYVDAARDLRVHIP
ncbi:MAG: hypothetical protein AMXMBFR34_47360 [Myxococcaceae bacterium]